MSGHSKWSKVKHQKATTDSLKGQLFTKASRAITIAVREGGGISDPGMNFRLRLAIEKARAVNMPKENIMRAIDRAKGEEGLSMDSALYEAYGPGGVGLLIEAVTDNKQRTVSDIKNILDRYGGSISSPGSVQYLFARCGIIIVPKRFSQDAMLEKALIAGASDIIEREDIFEVYTPDHELARVKTLFEQDTVPIQEAGIIMKPTMTISIDADARGKLSELVETLESLDDVQHVYANCQ